MPGFNYPVHGAFSFYMVTAIILSVVFISGYLVAFTMLRIGQQAEALQVKARGGIAAQYSKGNRIITVLFSFCSWITVLILVFTAWVILVKSSGYFDEPVKKPETK